MQKSRQFFLKYTDQVYRAPGEELWEDLLKTKRYLELHVLLYAKYDDKSDDTPVIFYHAELPDIMLEMIRQSFSSDFYIGSAKMRCIPSLALSVMTTFFFAHCESFLQAPERLFRDSEVSLDLVTQGVLQDKLTWFDKLSLVQFYGAASHSRACIWFFHRHHDIVYELCTLIYRGMEIVEHKIHGREINWQNETLACFLMSFRDDEDLELTSKLFGIHTVNHAIGFFKNLMDSIAMDYNLYQVIGKIVVRSKVLQHFLYIVKHVMMWFDPGLYLNSLLSAVSQALGTMDAVEQLLIENLSYCLEHKLSLTIETFKYWNHATKAPNTLAWFLLHAFCHSKKFGSNWCTYILCRVLEEAEEKVVDLIIENFGLDLMDLAHLVEISSPKKVRVQAVILEALLRYGRVQHKVYDYNDTFKGDNNYYTVLATMQRWANLLTSTKPL